jgi:predicted outer membrane protein
LRAAPKVDGPASPLTNKRVHGDDHSLLTDQVISRQLQAERQMLEAARLALSRGDNTSARIWCTRHRNQFDKPVLSQEREVIESLVAASEKPTSASKKY